MHVAADLGSREGAGPLAAGAGNARAIGAAAEHGRTGGAVEFGDRHHDGAFHRHQPPIRRAPLLQGLELDRVGRQIGDVEGRKDVLGRFRIIVGRTADQREAGQRDHRVDRAAAVLHENRSIAGR